MKLGKWLLSAITAGAAALIVVTTYVHAATVVLPEVKNNGITTLDGAITDVATTINITSAAALGLSDATTDSYITIIDATTRGYDPLIIPETSEIVKITAISTNALTVVRGQDGTTAKAFVDGDVVELRIIAATLDRVYDAITDGTDSISVNDILSAGDLTMSAGAVIQNKGADVASATTLPVISDGNFFDVTGTTEIQIIASMGIGTEITLQFDGALQLTHSANLVLPGAANITTIAGDVLTFVEYASADWVCVSYQSAITAVVTDHGGLTGLGDDDHTQYAKLAGDTFTGLVEIDPNAWSFAAVNANANDFTIQDNVADVGITIQSSNVGEANIYFGDSNSSVVGRFVYLNTSGNTLDEFQFFVNSTKEFNVASTITTVTGGDFDIASGDLIVGATTVTTSNLVNLEALEQDGATTGQFLKWDGVDWVPATVAGGGDALVANPLSQFAATTSAQLLGVLSDETGTGAAVFATSPTLVTPALGTPASGVMTNVTGTAAGLTSGNVTTNANLTGGVTSLGNAATVVTNANLTGDVTSSGNATTIAAGAVDVAMLANGTDGELITWSASGVAAVVAVGTAGQVLGSNGAGAAPTFKTPTPASQTWIVDAPAVGGVYGARIDTARTIDRIEVWTDAGTVDVNVEERTAPNTAGTNTMTSDLQGTSTSANQTTFANDAIAAGNWLYLDISAVSTAVVLGVTVSYE